ncbi:22621_t:CDS:1, partial [Gigaspora margarita]
SRIIYLPSSLSFQLLLDLMNKCLDAEPQNQLTAEKLVIKLENFVSDLKIKKKNEIYKQVEEIKDSGEI